MYLWNAKVCSFTDTDNDTMHLKHMPGSQRITAAISLFTQFCKARALRLPEWPAHGRHRQRPLEPFSLEEQVFQLLPLHVPSPHLTQHLRALAPYPGHHCDSEHSGQCSPGATGAFSSPRPAAGSLSADKQAWPPLPDAP